MKLCVILQKIAGNLHKTLRTAETERDGLSNVSITPHCAIIKELNLVPRSVLPKALRQSNK